MSETLLETRKIYAGYGKLTILNEISMQVNKGEIVAIIGPNGSGKSTLVKAVYGIANVFDGEVIFKGKNVTHIRPDKLTRLGASYVPQIANVFAELDVTENLELGAIIRGHNSVAETMDGVFQLFPILRERHKQKAKTLSGGERQMLAIGRSLMVTPDLLILDEPTAQLSPKLASELYQKILLIRDQGVTVLMVEQNAKKALEMSDRGYVLVAGKKAYEGPSKEILAHEEFGKIFLGLATGSEPPKPAQKT